MNRRAQRKSATCKRAAAKQTDSPKQRLNTTKKLAFAGLATLSFFALLEGVLLLCGVGPAHLRDDPYAGFVHHIPHFVSAMADDGTQLLTVAPSKAEVLNAVSFAPVKQADTYRVVCLGGSTTYGRPFYDKTSFAGWLRAFLPAADSSKKWEVINAGAISYASYRVAGLMDELARYDPDLFVIYTGHNEFLERRTYERLLNQPPWVREFLSLASHSRTMTVVGGALRSVRTTSRSQSRESLLTDDVKRIPINTVGPEAYRRDEAFRRQVFSHFRATLGRMLDVADKVQVPVVLVVPASNIGDFSPFKSEHSESITPDQAARWRQLYRRALQLAKEGRHEEGLTAIQQAESIDDRRADLHYAKGRVLLELERYGPASEALYAAKEEDICPLRAVDEVCTVIRELGGARGAIVVDFHELVSKHSDHQIPNRKMFHDHVHPTVEANRLLALRIIEQLLASGLMTLSSSWDTRAIDRITSEVESSMDRPLCAKQLVAMTAMLAVLGQDRMAREHALAAFEMSDRSADSAIAVTKILLDMNAWELAVKILREVVEDAPDLAAARCQLGKALLAGGDLKAAMGQAQKATELDPDLAEAYYISGLVRIEKSQLSAAEQYFQRAVRLAPQVAAVHESLGLAIGRQGRTAESVAHYRKALELNPKSLTARRHLEEAIRDLGRGS